MMAETINIDHRPVRRSGVRRAVTLVLAATVALVVWAVSVPLAGLDLTVGSGAAARSVGPGSVVVVPVLVGGLAWALLAFLESWLTTGRRVWSIIAWAVLAVSLLGPVTLGAAGGVLGSLIIMHLVVGVTLIVGLTRASTQRARSH